ncbi:MAG: hypothetical protein Kow00114_00880 [Kiloniellaceae bacterium]
MTPEGFERTTLARHRVTRQEIMTIDHGALADLLVKLSSGDPGLCDLLRALKPARPGPDGDRRDGGEAPAAGGERPFAEPFMVGESPAMTQVFDAIRRFARSDAPVLIAGESGTGKELAARAIHERSAFAKGPFVAINCGGLPASLVASELFGHEKGAFTGAHQRKIGKLEAADGGTLMLDEIGDMPLELQPHLLRFLQEMTIERVGGNAPIRLKLRVIAATNRRLEAQVEQGAFREDLFHRLNCLPLEMPPLRDRGDDIELLAHFFVRRFAAEMTAGGERRLGAPAVDAIRRYAWPGNVRELISRLRRAVVMSDNRVLTVHDLGLETAPRPPAAAAGPEPATAAPAAQPASLAEAATLEQAKARIEEKLVRDCLYRHAQNVTSAARDLGVSRVTLYRLIDKYRIRDKAVPGTH